jgi:hypothetical protein
LSSSPLLPADDLVLFLILCGVQLTNVYPFRHVLD